MSVIPLKADIHQRGLHVRLVPIADLKTAALEIAGARAAAGKSNRKATKSLPGEGRRVVWKLLEIKALG